MTFRPKRGAGLALGAAVVALVAAAAKGRARRYVVTEHSMRPALSPGDYIVTTLANDVKRGDIVVYTDPASPGRELIKRVVGLPGETVDISRGQVVIDGAVLAEPWADGPTYPPSIWVSPPGTIFTLGDSRSLSSGDGRTSGPIKPTAIYKARLRYWPPGSIGRL